MARGVLPSNGGSNNEDASTRIPDRSQLTLPLNSLAIPIYPQETQEDVQVGGHILFENYVQEEFAREGLREAPHAQRLLEAGDTADFTLPPNAANSNLRYRFSAVNTPVGASTPEGYKNTAFTRMGRTLRELADQFHNSRQGEEVRRQADGVDLSDINEERFFNLLIELFSEGFSAERLVALFSFCSRLLIRAARQNGMDLTKHLFTWCLRYILSKVCQWVYEQGGWGKVLGRMYDVIFKVCLVAALTVFIACGIVYIKKNW